MAVRTTQQQRDRFRSAGPKQELEPVRRLERPGLACFVVVFCLYACLAWRAWEPEESAGPLNWYTSFFWSLPILSSSLGLAGVVVQRRRRRVAPPLEEAPGRVDDLLIVVVPTVARLDNVVALERVVRSFLRQLPEHFSQVRVDVVIEEGSPGTDDVARLASHPGVRVITVPRRYSTERGTRFKARANHYAHELRVRDGEAKDDVWVLHMDDDTAVGPDTATALAGFINRQATAGPDVRHLAQGVLAFPRELAASRLLWLADAVRPGCDLSLFAATTGRGSPRIGLHGELLLVRASVEAEIGWDFGPCAIVEDAQFALEFCARYPARSEWFTGRSYGAAPANLRDFLRQRERWSWGLLSLVTDRAIPYRRRALLLTMVAVWASAPLQHPAIPLVLAVVLADASTGPVSPLIIPLWSLNIAFCVWLYWEGLKVNADASARAQRAWWEPAALVVLLPLFALWEAAGIARGLTKFLRGSDRSFTVITKSG
ncbi:glycosyltransferase family 2 protein [Nocardioides sp. CER19]|uniref:glycosyltransferase family 2 protein n=1 Tax=Nocardioides sp. CER19 TaxID=3038538 RepID=UPI00244B0E51|nr:glycosyltransferase family 2 protein [Nocardioides sp. CER19]MDH2414457.1 glycosyltransferase family 2 protein [Nocardioides sp. CER19]